jgi:hypothetical protein
MRLVDGYSGVGGGVAELQGVSKDNVIWEYLGSTRGCNGLPQEGLQVDQNYHLGVISGEVIFYSKRCYLGLKSN